MVLQNDYYSSRKAALKCEGTIYRLRAGVDVCDCRCTQIFALCKCIRKILEMRGQDETNYEAENSGACIDFNGQRTVSKNALKVYDNINEVYGKVLGDYAS